MMRKLRSNNKGVSTIIAAALIVALTVILAVALGSTVLSNAPQAAKPYQLTIAGEASVSGNIVLTHVGGDPISLDQITIRTYIPSGWNAGVTYTTSNYDWTTSSGTSVIQAGDTLTIPFSAAFGTSAYGPMAPAAGEQFVVELYYNSQPITSVTIIAQP